MPFSPKRWAIYSAALALALLWGRLVEQESDDVRRARTASTPTTTPLAAVERSELANVDLAQLAPRTHAESTADLFGVHSSTDLEEEASRKAEPPPSPPQAPPIPFLFLGKLVDGDATTVFLMKGDRNYVVRGGDTLDGDYRVEEIGEQTMMFTYLPLDARQSLGIGSATGVVSTNDVAALEVRGPLAPDAPPTHDLTKLVWVAPAQVALGEEFTIEVGLPAGPQPRSGRLELVYDRLLLAVLGGATTQESPDAKTQRAVVEVIGPGFIGGQPTPSEVRFRVLAGNPTSTRIGIENLSATTVGSALNLQSPASHGLAIVSAGRQ